MKTGKIRTAQPGLAVAEGRTKWGWMRVWASDRGVVAVEGPTPTRGETPPHQPLAGPARERAQQGLAEVTEYLAGKRREFTVPVDWSGVTGFTRQVLEACASVPFGQQVSYGELARAVGSPRAARAAGQALGRNRAPLIVPCHRVIATGGGLGGFGGGLEMKQRLLELERKWGGGGGRPPGTCNPPPRPDLEPKSAK